MIFKISLTDLQRKCEYEKIRYFDFLCKTVRKKKTSFLKNTQLQRSLQKKLEEISKNEDHFKGGERLDLQDGNKIMFISLMV